MPLSNHKILVPFDIYQHLCHASRSYTRRIFRNHLTLKSYSARLKCHWQIPSLDIGQLIVKLKHPLQTSYGLLDIIAASPAIRSSKNSNKPYHIVDNTYHIKQTKTTKRRDVLVPPVTCHGFGARIKGLSEFQRNYHTTSACCRQHLIEIIPSRWDESRPHLWI